MKLPNSIFDNFKSQLSSKPQHDTQQSREQPDIKNSISRNPGKDVGFDVPAP